MDTRNNLSQELSLLESDLIRLYNEHEDLSNNGDPDFVIPEINIQIENTIDRIIEIKKDLGIEIE